MNSLRFLVAVAAAASINASAQQYPDRPIRMIVGFPPGGPSDVVARAVGPKLAEAWSQQVVIENRPGASGNLAMELVAKARPDGYTMIMSGNGYAVGPALHSKLPYSFKDFAAVSLVAKAPLVLVVHPALPAGSVKELIALAKSKPGQINYASGGNGTSPHLGAEMFKFTAGVDLVHVPYKGTNDFISDLVSGRVQVAFMSPLIAPPYVKAGRLKPLGVSSLKRSPSWPDLPSIAEAGVPGYEVESWYMILVPAGTPREVVAKLSRQLAHDLKVPDVQEKLVAAGVEAGGGTPEQAEAYVQTEAARWSKVLRAANVKAD
jgi:tripartite-type tricarboxylate transporter receptor subunit TctC